ncbi:alpha/beta hydrolase [Rubrivirga sp.]|uniref:alpha/beta hydrolase n=1 Tax=Rubrivirga sp. TaxID=1885344 RepID=UPI003B5257F5
MDLHDHPARDPDGPFDAPVTFDDVAERIGSVPIDGTPDEMRRAYAWLIRGDALGRPIPVGRPARIGQVQGWAVPPGRDAETASDVEIRVVWLHGGGYVFGSPETHWRAAATFAARLGETVFMPRYPLAPEALWPAPLRDALDVARAVQDRGLALAVVGDSAGGHLTLGTVLQLAREGRPATVAAVFSPNADRTGLSDTREPNSETDAMNNDEDDRRCASISTGPVDLPDDDVTISPLVDDLSLLPPLWVEVGGTEVLLGEAQILAEKGKEAGAQVELHVEPDAFHMWQLWTPWLAEADASLQRAAGFVADHLR